ncbi:hypothetical protein VCR29J2_50162 [Vibrio coralliirubri]|nr:hypothetical protein VCR29J2_50162 [Vibrio coralliirubri]
MVARPRETHDLKVLLKLFVEYVVRFKRVIKSFSVIKPQRTLGNRLYVSVVERSELIKFRQHIKHLVYKIA